jgi:tetratricopeptide (TPR) repeat protein
MKSSTRIMATASIVLVICMMSSVLLLRKLDQLRSGGTTDEVLYISSPTVLKRISLGYGGLLADVYWTRAVQYFGSKHHNGAQHYELLAPLLEITTALDPQLLVAYEYGANFLAPKPPDGAGVPRRAIELAEYGIRNNPNEWKLYYQLGFIYYTELQDYAAAADAFDRGSRVPKAHPWLKLMAAQMAEHAGDLQTARMLWTTMYQSTQDRAIRANAAAHLRALQVDEDVLVLERLVNIYRDKTGRVPNSFSELEAAGLLRGTAADPLGHPYRLMPDGHVVVRVPDDLPFLKKGIPPEYVPPQKPKLLPSD